jgi:hypothetical protein
MRIEEGTDLFDPVLSVDIDAVAVVEDQRQFLIYMLPFHVDDVPIEGYAGLWPILSHH